MIKVLGGTSLLLLLYSVFVTNEWLSTRDELTLLTEQHRAIIITLDNTLKEKEKIRESNKATMNSLLELSNKQRDSRNVIFDLLSEVSMLENRECQLLIEGGGDPVKNKDEISVNALLPDSLNRVHDKVRLH